MNRWLPIVLVVTALAPPPAARSAELRTCPFITREGVDLPVMAGLGTWWLVAELGMDELGAQPVFDPTTYSQLSDMDRAAVGKWDIRADAVSDGLLGVSFVLPFVLAGIDTGAWASRRFEPHRWLWADAVVLMESVFLAGALTNLVKWSYSRYRPYMYISSQAPEVYDAILNDPDPDVRAAYEEQVESGDAALSFWSGHTAMAVAAFTASATLLTAKHLDGPPLPLVLMWTGTVGAGAAMAILRVESGNHYPSDVIVGAVIGASIGVAVPALHLRRGDATVGLTPVGGPRSAGLVLDGRF